MTEAQKRMKKYMTAIERRLNLPREVRNRVMNDLQSSIQSRREAGQTDEQIYAELGTPAEVAAELNAQMGEFAYVKSPWRWAALAGAVISGLFLAWTTAVNWLMRLLFGQFVQEQQSLGIIGGADGPTAIFVATTPGPDYEVLLGLAVLAVCLLAWWRLSHLKKK